MTASTTISLPQEGNAVNKLICLLVGCCLAIGFVSVAQADFADAEAAFARGDYDTALKEFKSIAEQGDALAQNKLAGMYYSGYGVPHDYKEAEKRYRKAAEQGYANAQLNLGFMYQQGQGVPQDYEEAVKWYRKAAEQGGAYGQLNLGMLYRDGQGVPQDYVLAYMWFNLAAAQGNAFAISDRDTAAEEMTSDQIAEAQRLAREWKPKE